MFNFTPPSSENVAKYCGILLVVFLLSCAYMRGYQAGMCGSDLASTCGADVPEPVELSKSLFFNPDSIAYYSAIAAREDDPRALFEPPIPTIPLMSLPSPSPKPTTTSSVPPNSARRTPSNI